MPVAITTLVDQALRRVGVAIVPVASRPALTATVSVTTIAARALQALGVVVPASAWPLAPTIIPVATIATNALIWLGVIASDETPSALDQALAAAKVAALHDGLIAQGAVTWAVGAIPQAVSEDMTMLAALHLASAFGKQADPAQQPVLEARVRKMALLLQAQGLGEARVGVVHDALVGQGFVSWPLTAIPQAVADEYVGLTGMRLAPLFGLPADPAGIPAIEARIRQVSVVMLAPSQALNALMGVHQDLAARGRVRWTVWDIPEAVSVAYVNLAAAILAPRFGAKSDPRDAIEASMSLARYIALPTSGERVAAEYF